MHFSQACYQNANVFKRTERKPGDMTKMCILSKIIYIYFEIKVFKAQMGCGGTEK